jgi:dTDP-4-dehydrorhamnose 3,5-epimerase
MSITVTPLFIPSVLLIEPKVFRDHRGFFLETFQERKYAEAGLAFQFVQDNHSRSVGPVLRGLHYQLQNPQAKLVYVVSGEIFDVAVDIRRGSPYFGAWTGTRLSDRNQRQLFIPEGFAHGFVVTSETADVLYKCTDFYAPGDEYGILWKDEAIGIDWPVSEPLLSGKDQAYPRLAEAPESELPVYKEKS